MFGAATVAAEGKLYLPYGNERECRSIRMGA